MRQAARRWVAALAVLAGVLLLAIAVAFAACLFHRPRETIGVVILMVIMAQPILLVAVLIGARLAAVRVVRGPPGVVPAR